MSTVALSPPAAPAAPAAAAPDPIARALADEQRYGLKLWTLVRLAVIAIIALWITSIMPIGVALYYYGTLAGFAAIAGAHYVLIQNDIGRSWAAYVFPFLELVMLGFAVFVPNPMAKAMLPLGAQLHFGNETFFFIFIAAAIFTYSPKIVLCVGIDAAIVWGIGVAWIASAPEAYYEKDFAALQAMSFAERAQYLGNLNHVDVDVQIQTALMFVIVAAILATGVWRVRRLVFANARAERARTNLARFFSPNVVEELAARDEPLGSARRQEVAVMFADIVGFTTLAEDRPPDEVLALLRSIHHVVAEQVFDHGGTLDKYLGDGVMATFGTPQPTPRDAANALACARAIRRAIAAWNATRGTSHPVVRLGIGVHYGPVLLGDIGDASRLEYTVIGDTVNVASRLERLTRELGCDLAVSDALVGTLGADADLATGLTRQPPQPIRGRAERIVVWTL